MSINQRGDTIIEVLIACAIAGVVIAGAFVTVNHSLNNSRQAQEHEEALKIAESQLEALRGSVSNAALFPASPMQFCMTNVGTATPPTPSAAFANAAYNPSQIDTGYYPAVCQQSSLGSYKYNISIVTAPSGTPNLNIFTINVDWYGPTGHVENVGLIYEALKS